MKALIINCSPVKTGATATIAGIVSAELADRYEVKEICIKEDVEPRKQEIVEFCKGI